MIKYFEIIDRISRNCARVSVSAITEQPGYWTEKPRWRPQDTGRHDAGSDTLCITKYVESFVI